MLADQISYPAKCTDGVFNLFSAHYIARKVEKPLLDSPNFKEQRFKMSIPSRLNRGNLDPVRTILST